MKTKFNRFRRASVFLVGGNCEDSAVENPQCRAGRILTAPPNINRPVEGRFQSSAPFAFGGDARMRPQGMGSKTTLDSWLKTRYYQLVTMTVEIGSGQLAELVKQVQAGNEVLLTQGNKPVARLVPAADKDAPHAALQIRSLAGHRVLTPVISQQELAEDMFARQ